MRDLPQRFANVDHRRLDVTMDSIHSRLPTTHIFSLTSDGYLAGPRSFRQAP